MSQRTVARRRAASGESVPSFRYPFNQHFIDEWGDSLAWLTGLIWSDGAHYNNSIDICSKDRDLIETVAAVVGSQCVLPKNNGTAWRTIFTSRRVAEFFRALGLTRAKSFIVPWPDVPEEWQGSFVRGLIDGDGSVLLRQSRPGQQVADLSVSVVGASPNLRAGLGAWLASHGIRYSDGMSHHTVWKISIQQHDSLRRLHGLIYPSADVPCLGRKRRPYDLWLATPRVRAGRPSR